MKNTLILSMEYKHSGGMAVVLEKEYISFCITG